MKIDRTLRRILVFGAAAACCAQTLPQTSASNTEGKGTASSDPNRIDVVCLDAGHGGKDPGNLGTGRYKTREKDVALAVTKMVGNYITANFPDVKVVYTRTDDRFIELKDRCRIANEAQADVFISIHCNANDNPDPHGSETYVMGMHKTEANMRTAMRENASILLEEGHELKYEGYDPKDPDSQIIWTLRQNRYLDHSLLLSEAVQKQFKDRVGRPDRGVKQAGFLVITYTTMPAVLVELGFLSNKEEEDFLQGEKGQDLLASGVYRAFKEYKGKIEGADVRMEPIEVKPDSTRVDTTKAVNKVEESGVRFKVQIVTSSKKLPLNAKTFKGMPVEELQSADMWKYMVGDERTLDGARTVQEQCKKAGFDGCFIVAFQNGQRIELRQAVTLTRDH